MVSSKPSKPQNALGAFSLCRRRDHLAEHALISDFFMRNAKIQQRPSGNLYEFIDRQRYLARNIPYEDV